MRPATASAYLLGIADRPGGAARRPERVHLAVYAERRPQQVGKLLQRQGCGADLADCLSPLQRGEDRIVTRDCRRRQLQGPVGLRLISHLLPSHPSAAFCHLSAIGDARCTCYATQTHAHRSHRTASTCPRRSDQGACPRDGVAVRRWPPAVRDQSTCAVAGTKRPHLSIVSVGRSITLRVCILGTRRAGLPAPMSTGGWRGRLQEGGSWSSTHRPDRNFT